MITMVLFSSSHSLSYCTQVTTADLEKHRFASASILAWGQIQQAFKTLGREEMHLIRKFPLPALKKKQIPKINGSLLIGLRAPLFFKHFPASKKPRKSVMHPAS